MILFFWLAIVFHEAGHYFTAEKYGLKPKFKREGWEFFVYHNKKATKEQEKKIHFNGIMLGLIPLFALWFMVGAWCLILIMLYFVGCKSDIKQIYKITRGKK